MKIAGEKGACVRISHIWMTGGREKRGREEEGERGREREEREKEREGEGREGEREGGREKREREREGGREEREKERREREIRGEREILKVQVDLVSHTEEKQVAFRFRFWSRSAVGVQLGSQVVRLKPTALGTACLGLSSSSSSSSPSRSRAVGVLIHEHVCEMTRGRGVMVGW